MKTIDRSTEITYSSVEIREVITMLPLMKELADKFRALHEHIIRNEEPSQFKVAEYIRLGNQLIVLFNLGFCTPNIDDVQFDPKYFDFK